MGRKTILIDDLDSSELPDGTEPVRLGLGRTTSLVYLSEDNHAKLLAALEPFTANAEKEAPRPSSGKSESAKDGPSAGEVRVWGQENGVSDSGKGRVSVDLKEAYNNAHPDAPYGI